MFIISVILAQIGVGWLFIRYLIQRDRGSKEPARPLFLAGALGVMAVGLAMALEGRFLPGNFNPESIDQLSLAQIAWGSLLIGLIEEGAKLLPLALVLYRRRYFNEVTDGLVYFGIAGMMFGLVENVFYSLAYGSGTGLGRLLTIPFLHAGFCVIFGWLLARRKVLKSSWWSVLGGLLLAVGLHAVYDFGLFYGAWYTILASFVLTVVLNIAVFRLYTLAERSDRRLGLSTDRENWYCPHCGAPNPARELHCPACGRRP